VKVYADVVRAVSVLVDPRAIAADRYDGDGALVGGRIHDHCAAEKECANAE
jgi:hypothetical protein